MSNLSKLKEIESIRLLEKEKQTFKGVHLFDSTVKPFDIGEVMYLIDNPEQIKRLSHGELLEFVRTLQEDVHKYFSPSIEYKGDAHLAYFEKWEKQIAIKNFVTLTSLMMSPVAIIGSFALPEVHHILAGLTVSTTMAIASIIASITSIARPYKRMDTIGDETLVNINQLDVEKKWEGKKFQRNLILGTVQHAILQPGVFNHNNFKGKKDAADATREYLKGELDVKFYIGD